MQLKLVIIQAADEAVPKLGRDDVVDRYCDSFWAAFRCDPEEECSIEELTGPNALLDRDVAASRLQRLGSAPHAHHTQDEIAGPRARR